MCNKLINVLRYDVIKRGKFDNHIDPVNETTTSINLLHATFSANSWDNLNLKLLKWIKVEQTVMYTLQSVCRLVSYLCNRFINAFSGTRCVDIYHRATYNVLLFDTESIYFSQLTDEKQNFRWLYWEKHFMHPNDDFWSTRCAANCCTDITAGLPQLLINLRILKFYKFT